MAWVETWRLKMHWFRQPWEYFSHLSGYFQQGRVRMKRSLMLCGLLVAALAVPPVARQWQRSRIAQISLKAGDIAPDFALLSDQWQTVRLSDFRGKKNVFLAVYVLAFSEG
jgi:hypothetical protein